MNRAELLDLLTTAALIGRDTYHSTITTRGDMTEHLQTWPTIRKAFAAFPEERECGCGETWRDSECTDPVCLADVRNHECCGACTAALEALL